MQLTATEEIATAGERRSIVGISSTALPTSRTSWKRAKGSGDIEALRQIASGPHGFTLRQGSASLDFRD